VSNVPISNAKRIARTEGHRIQQASTMDAQKAAKTKGADVLKQWDASLDGRTRPTHRRLDGQIREVDEPFEMDGKSAMFPGDFGNPAEDCNCRCASLTRARWGLDEDELKTLQERAEFFGLDKTKDFDDFKNKYLKAASEPLEKSSESGKINVGLQFFAEKDIAKQKSSSLKKGMAKYQKQIEDHQQKIDHPEDFVEDWASKDVRYQNGLKKHWQKEIKYFKQSIDDRVAELKKRGDYDE
jgi:uncharacterized protein with gpF-like domain